MFGVAFALRCVELGQESFWTDEGVGLSALRTGIVAHLRDVETSPPLYFILNKIWALLFGESYVALRLAAVLPGALSVPAIYVCARRWGLGVWWGVALMVWVALHPLLYFQSQQARHYALLLLLGIVWLSTIPPLLLEDARRRDQAAFLLAGFLGFSTHYYFAFYLLASGAGVVLAWSLRGIAARQGLRLVALHAALGAACCAYVPLLRHQLGLGHTEYLPIPVCRDLARVYGSMNAFGSETQGWGWVLPWGLGLLFVGVAGCFVAARRGAENAGKVGMILALAIVPNVAAFAVSVLWKPVFFPARYSTVFIPAFMIAMAMGWSAWRPVAQRLIAVGLFAALIPVAAATLHQYWSERQLFDWIATVRTIEAEWREGDVAVFHPGWLAADYLNNGGKPLRALGGEQIEGIRAEPRVWLVMWEDTPEREAGEALKSLRAERAGAVRIEGAGITLSLIQQR